jgi:hypothetical protein
MALTATATPDGVVLSIDEEVAAEILAAYVAQDYILDGEPDRQAVIERLVGIVLPAVVSATGERGTKSITRTTLMSEVFPKVVGAEGWAETDNPEVAARVYRHFDGNVIWRTLDMGASAPIQKAAMEQGFLLCRTTSTPGHVDAVYVTQDVECIRLDFSAPYKAKVEKEAQKHAVQLACATKVLPQFANIWEGELRKSLAQAKRAGEAALMPALDAVRNGDEDEQ